MRYSEELQSILSRFGAGPALRDEVVQYLTRGLLPPRVPTEAYRVPGENGGRRRDLEGPIQEDAPQGQGDPQRRRRRHEGVRPTREVSSKGDAEV